MERECHLVARYGLTRVASDQSQEPDLETGITKVIATVTVTMATRYQHPAAFLRPELRPRRVLRRSALTGHSHVLFKAVTVIFCHFLIQLSCY